MVSCQPATSVSPALRGELVVALDPLDIRTKEVCERARVADVAVGRLLSRAPDAGRHAGRRCRRNICSSRGVGLDRVDHACQGLVRRTYTRVRSPKRSDQAQQRPMSAVRRASVGLAKPSRSDRWRHRTALAGAWRRAASAHSPPRVVGRQWVQTASGVGELGRPRAGPNGADGFACVCNEKRGLIDDHRRMGEPALVALDCVWQRLWLRSTATC